LPLVKRGMTLSNLLGYASVPESRPTGWIIGRYWVWVAGAVIGRASGEAIVSFTEVRGDWPAVAGPRLAFTSSWAAAVLFLVGCAYLIRRRGRCRCVRVWLAWAVAGLLSLLLLGGEQTLFPVIYK
jgi:hypothetical protein